MSASVADPDWNREILREVPLLQTEAAEVCALGRGWSWDRAKSIGTASGIGCSVILGVTIIATEYLDICSFASVSGVALKVVGGVALAEGSYQLGHRMIDWLLPDRGAILVAIADQVDLIARALLESNSNGMKEPQRKITELLSLLPCSDQEVVAPLVAQLEEVSRLVRSVESR